MPDIIKMINDPAGYQPEMLSRRLELENWTREQGLAVAQAERIAMTEEHWQVVDFLRDYYIRCGVAPAGRVLAATLDEVFSAHGGAAYLHMLFPGGPVAQGCRIGGVPIPPYTEDRSFGSAM